MSAVEIQLHYLVAERSLDSVDGINQDAAYTAQLAETHHAYVGTAVMEIAVLRAELSGPQVG